MASKKKILINSMSYCAIKPRRTVWYEDLPITFHRGRERVHRFITVAGRDYLHEVIRREEWLYQRSLDPCHRAEKFLDLVNLGMSENDAFDVCNSNRNHYLEVATHFRDLLARSAGHDFFYDDSYGADSPTIWISIGTPNRKQLEAAITWYLRQYEEVTTPLRFSWSKSTLYVTGT
jgi:hypothetical protein